VLHASRMPTYFISHGGGPWAFMEGEFRKAFANLEQWLLEFPRELPSKPKAILMISGHWEDNDFAVMANPNPPMVYDYYGFPEHTYYVKYPAPGAPELAEKVRELISKAGFKAHLDYERGFDHGTFVRLAVTYPNADMPIVQLSIRSDYDPEAHLRIGRALSPLRDEGVRIMGSGLSYHNLRLFDARAAQPSRAFDSWLQETLVESEPNERWRRLIAWEKAPAARIAHPREDHLIPLMVAVGAAESEKGETVYHEDDFMGGLSVSSFRFG